MTHLSSASLQIRTRSKTADWCSLPLHRSDEYELSEANIFNPSLFRKILRNKIDAHESENLSISKSTVAYLFKEPVTRLYRERIILINKICSCGESCNNKNIEFLM